MLIQVRSVRWIPWIRSESLNLDCYPRVFNFPVVNVSLHNYGFNHHVQGKIHYFDWAMASIFASNYQRVVAGEKIQQIAQQQCVTIVFEVGRDPPKISNPSRETKSIGRWTKQFFPAQNISKLYIFIINDKGEQKPYDYPYIRSFLRSKMDFSDQPGPPYERIIFQMIGRNFKLGHEVLRFVLHHLRLFNMAIERNL